MQTIKLDSKKLLGFRLGGIKAGSKRGGKVGSKKGVKS